MVRKVAECRQIPSDSPCTLAFSGEEDEVVNAAVQHAVSVHGQRDTPELRQAVRASLLDDSAEPPEAGPPPPAGEIFDL